MLGQALPVDIWLLVLGELADDLNFLWSSVRAVSRFLRACVDEFFRHSVVPNTLIDLHYSDIHTRHGPVYSYIHVPMLFDRFSADRSRAVFQQRAYKQIDACRHPGSVRGWVPFIEKYNQETRKDKPKILNKNKADGAPPLWEREHKKWRNTLHDERKKNYLLNMGNMTSIARGDRPPFYIKIFHAVNDTDLVDIAVDCKQREVSFDWRQTYALFFREQNLAARAYNAPGIARCYDKELEAAAFRYAFQGNRYNHAVRARQKRLVDWTAKNKARMSPEIRLWTETRVDAETVRMGRFLHRENLRTVPTEDSEASKEIVPEKLADDHPELLFWPWVDNDGFFVPKNRAGLECCTIL